MEQEGPSLQTLMRRLAECPADFLADPRIGSNGTVHVAAVVNDVLYGMGAQPLNPGQAAPFRPKEARERNRLSLTLIAAWLLADPWFRARPGLNVGAFRFLTEGVQELAAVGAATKYVNDPDRREELARLCLKGLDLRPAGETMAQAQDRLTTISTVERQRVIWAAREAEERARAIREAMVRQRAQESADKWSRE
ncbi:MAG: hypothetical protein WCF84_09170 [Anaerolineae bacterium]